MDSSVCIAQKGTVEEIAGHRIKVRVHRETACGHCTASGMCNLSGMEESIIEVNDNGHDLKTGDHVEIAITAGMGNKAVMLGYMLPFLLLISLLILLHATGFPEWVSGLVALVGLGIYYLLLYMFRNRLRKTFTFTISKIG